MAVLAKVPPATPQLLISIFVVINIVYLIARSVYRAYFHPLAKFPGPLLWRISSLPNTYHLMKGTLPYRTHEIHEKYGPIVRLSPSDLSYILEEAWADIYERKSASRNAEMDRDENQIVDPPDDRGAGSKFWSTDHVAHARVRRNLNPGFSEKALREQEPSLKKHIDFLMQRLHENCHSPLDIVKWFNLTTFDVIGDLTFGESFDSLKNGETHFWVDTIVSTLKASAIITSWKRYRIDKIMTKLFSTKSVKDTMNKHQAITAEKLRKRLDYTRSHPDFLSTCQKNFGTPDGPTWKELVSLVGAFIPAGSETTATLLAGTIYFLSLNPSMRKKLCDEVRTTFESESEINMQNVSTKLPYMLAVLNETLRLFPPAAASFNRITPPGGCVVVGDYIPGGMSLAVNQWSANHSELNFRRPYEFLPQRWMGDAEFADDKRKAMQPFSVGPRNCIGRSLAYAESRLILARFVWNFDFSVEQDVKGWADKQPVYIVYQKPS